MAVWTGRGSTQVTRRIRPGGGASVLTVAAAWMSLATAASAQQPVPFDRPDAVSSEQFSLVRGVRELSDGRVLITDYVEQRLVLLDAGLGSVRDLGRVGGGPQEYRLPAELLAMPGDSTLLVDFGNQRLGVIGPDGRFARTMSMNAHGESYAMRPRAVGADGTLFFPFPVWAGPPPPRDSVPVGRWRPGGPVEQVGSFQIRAHTVKPPGPSNGLPYVAFARQDGWAASPDGRVVVVRSDPYRVEWYGPGSAPVRGPVIEFDEIPVTMEDRRRHVRDFLMSSAIAGRGGDEQGAYAPVPAEMRTEEAINRAARTALFEDTFPPFVPGSVRIDSRGRVWVQRYLSAGRGPEFDMFDDRGRRAGRFTFPMGRTVVGFGEGTVYTTVADEYDLLTLERYRIP